ncbi:hypothetical protein F4777DRAFT_573134 [Nemania sp. FL0916]|nr:hypothetical protein F4777DRAFT_573134 [Nemania sp. FL0916]
MATVDGINSCNDLLEKQAAMFSMIRNLNTRKHRRRNSEPPPTCGVAGDDVGCFFKAVRKALDEFRTIQHVLMRSNEKITERWLTPEAMQEKKRNSRFWTDLEAQLHQGQHVRLKEVHRSGDRSMVIKGRRGRSTSTPIVGVLVATKKTEADMKQIEKEGIPAWQESIKNAAEIPEVSHDELSSATGEDYRYKLMCWGTDWARLSEVSLIHDVALVEHTRGIKEFWMIESLGVLEHERGKGIGRRMVEEIERRAKADNLPIILWADRDATAFYIRCGFRALDTFTYRGGERERPDAIMKWVWEKR